MNAGEIEDALKKNPQTQKYFKGVFAADQIPWDELNDKSETKCFVFNLDKSTRPGSHWICIILNRSDNRRNVYFDSYGMSPLRKSFEEFMDFCYVCNNVQLQYQLSTACGQWCLYAINHILVEDQALELIALMFNHKDKLQNDYICNHMVKRIYKINPEVVCKDFLKESLETEIQHGGGTKCQTCQPLSYVVYTWEKKKNKAV